MGESQTLKGTSFNAEDSSEENDMAQGFFQDQLLNLTEGFKNTISILLGLIVLLLKIVIYFVLSQPHKTAHTALLSIYPI